MCCAPQRLLAHSSSDAACRTLWMVLQLHSPEVLNRFAQCAARLAIAIACRLDSQRVARKISCGPQRRPWPMG